MKRSDLEFVGLRSLFNRFAVLHISLAEPWIAGTSPAMTRWGRKQTNVSHHRIYSGDPFICVTDVEYSVAI